MGLVRTASKNNLVFFFPNERFWSCRAVLLCAAKKLPYTLVSYDVCYVLLFCSTYKQPKPRFILVENEVSMFGITEYRAHTGGTNTNLAAKICAKHTV